MQVFCGLAQTGFLVDGSGVHHEDNTADILGISESGCSVVAELAMSGRVEDDEAARALEGWVAGRAVVRRCGNVRVGEEGLDGQRGGGGVGSGDGAALSLFRC